MDWSALGFGPKYQCPKNFAVQVSPGNGETRTGIYRSFRTQEFVMTYDPALKTAFDLLTSSVAKYPKNRLHGKIVGNSFEFRTYEEVFEDVKAFGSGLKAIGAMVPDTTKEMQILGLMGRNHGDWMIAEYACFGFGGTTVPFYDSLSSETLKHLIDNCGLSTVVCDVNSAQKLLEAKQLGATTLTTLIVYGVDTDEQIQALKKAADTGKVRLIPYAEVLETGRKKIVPFEPPTANTVFSFVFTSGSTGKFPKAALLTHSAALANVSSILYEYDNTVGFELKRGAEYHLSYLPCAHAMERTCTQLVMAIGGAVGYSSGVREKVLDEIAKFRPTMFVCVPRILNRLHDKIMSTALSSGWLKASIFTAALEAKKRGVAEGYLKHPVYDALVFDAVKKKLGLDRVTRINTGSAPISAEVLGFYRAVFGVPVCEGYGATEMTCIACGTHGYHMKSGHVGGPAVIAEIRLIAIPSMPHYKITDTKHGDLDVRGRGEICVRGPCIMREYYRNPEATKSAIDADGFYMSGDVGALLPDGTLKIIDRKNNIFKLSNGEYVSPETIENKMVRTSLISQAYVHGDPLHARLVAIVVVDPDTALPYAKAHGLPENVKDLCANADFYKAVMKDIETTCKNEGLRGFEVPFKVYLEFEPFTEKNVLTATLKLQRTLAFAKYGEVLNKLLGDEK